VKHSSNISYISLGSIFSHICKEKFNYANVLLFLKVVYIIWSGVLESLPLACSLHYFHLRNHCIGNINSFFNNKYILLVHIFCIKCIYVQCSLYFILLSYTTGNIYFS